jgi:hypothetical protein
MGATSLRIDENLNVVNWFGKAISTTILHFEV